MAGDKVPVWRHQIVLVDREMLTIDGVASLGSYDEKEIAMETERGAMTVRGDELSVKQLNLEDGKIVVEGLVRAIEYEDARKERRGLLNRLLK